MDKHTKTAILQHIVKVTHVAIRVFNTSTQIHYYGQEHREESFANEAKTVSLLKKMAKPGVPIILGWHSVCYALIEDRMSLYYLIGPLTTGLDAARLPQVNIQIKQLPNTPSCDTDVWFDELSLLQNTLTNSSIQATDIYQANNIGAVEVHENALRTTAYFYNNQENNFKHNPYDQEVRELKSIEEGNIERLNDSMHETFDGEFATLGPTKLRSMKNLAIVDLALIARAAIKGGLDYEQSFSINDQYIRSVEMAETVEDAGALALEAKVKYTQLVHDLNQNTDTNRLIKRSKQYVQTHLHDAITLGIVANYCYVSPQYLSKIFHSSQKMTFQSYVTQQKIEATKRDLIYSHASISEIATNFNYSSASHYSAVFKRATKTTPSAYRNMYGKI